MSATCCERDFAAAALITGYRVGSALLPRTSLGTSLMNRFAWPSLRPSHRCTFRRPPTAGWSGTGRGYSDWAVRYVGVAVRGALLESVHHGVLLTREHSGEPLVFWNLESGDKRAVERIDKSNLLLRCSLRARETVTSA